MILNKILKIVILIFLTINAKSQTEIAPLVGIGVFPKENFTFMRYGIAVNNIYQHEIVY
jgi:hypothetical protein